MTPHVIETTFPEINFNFPGRSPERRREPRYAIPRGMKLEVRLPPDRSIVEAELRDLSLNGLGLVAQDFIAPGESITFPVGLEWVVAEVRYCRPEGTGFAIGAFICDIVSQRGN
jgi:hypothetical protein